MSDSPPLRAGGRQESAQEAPDGHEDDPYSHGDPLRRAVERCTAVFETLRGRNEPQRSRWAPLHRWLPANRRSSDAVLERAVRALHDVVGELVTRQRYDHWYVLDRLAELERRSMEADDLERRLEAAGNAHAAVVDAHDLVSWFAPRAPVLWRAGPHFGLRQVLESAGLNVIDAPAEGSLVGGAVVEAGAQLIDECTRQLAPGGLLVVVLPDVGDIPTAVASIAERGMVSHGLTWVRDRAATTEGMMVLASRRRLT